MGSKLKRTYQKLEEHTTPTPVPFAAALMAYNRKGERSQISGLTFNLVKPE